jgi:hypothetical protein
MPRLARSARRRGHGRDGDSQMVTGLFSDRDGEDAAENTSIVKPVIVYR